MEQAYAIKKLKWKYRTGKPVIEICDANAGIIGSYTIQYNYQGFVFVYRNNSTYYVGDWTKSIEEAKQAAQQHYENEVKEHLNAL